MNASAVGKARTEVDRAYLAGLIDGDGCIMATIERHGEKKFGFRVRVEIKITQKESSLLTSLQKQYNVGRIAPNRTTCDWIVRDKQQVWLLLGIFAPYTRAKVKQVAIAREILAARVATLRDLQRIARLADTLSTFNVRSKNRRKNFASMIKARSSSND